MDDSPFITHGSKVMYQNPWITIREYSITHPSGNKGIYGVVETNDSVIMIAERQDGAICFVMPYRYPYNVWSTELPGGGGDQEDPLVAAQRELREETGLASDEWHHLGALRLMSIQTEYMHVFLARNVQPAHEYDHGEEGIKKMEFLMPDEIRRMALAGEIAHSQSLSALYLYNAWLTDNAKK